MYNAAKTYVHKWLYRSESDLHSCEATLGLLCNCPGKCTGTIFASVVSQLTYDHKFLFFISSSDIWFIISSNFILGRSFYVFQPPIGDYQWTNICGASCCNSSRINWRSFWHIFLYWPLLGGNNGASCLNTMECYNPITGGWTTLAPMIFCRSTHDVAVVHGILYAVGGNDGSSSLNSVEKYEPKSNKWTTVESMSTRRSSVGVVVADVLLVWSVWLREGGEGGSSFIY